MEAIRSPEVPLSRIGDEVRQLKIHDVSSAYRPGLPLFFALPKVRVRTVAERAPDAEAAGSAPVWELAEQSGSHADAPSHFVSGGVSIDNLPADLLFLQPFKKLLFRQPFKKFDVPVDEPRPGGPVSREMPVAAAERGGFGTEAGDIAMDRGTGSPLRVLLLTE